MKLCCLNEKDLCWDVIFEQPFEYGLLVAEAFTLPSKMVFMVVATEGNRPESNLKTFFFLFHPTTNVLSLWKKFDSDKRYLFVPEDVFQ